jgi:hypothetical protein
MAWRDVKVVEVFAVDQHVGDDLPLMAQDPPRLRAISHHSGKMVPRLVIRMRALKVGHRLLTGGEMDGGDRRRVLRPGFSDDGER